MDRTLYMKAAAIGLLFCGTVMACEAQIGNGRDRSMNLTIYDRTRVDSWQWFASPPAESCYGFVESLLRIGVAQRVHSWDWEVEVAQPSIVDAPADAVSPGAI